MVSLFTSPNHLLHPSRLVADLNFYAISLPPVVMFSPRQCRRGQRPPPAVSVSLEISSFGFGVLRRMHYEGSPCCRCKGWESEGDLALEAKILEFMKKSKKPDAFPTKEELMDAGRMDLVEAIVTRSGWFSLGWDLDDDNEEEKVQEHIASRNCDDERAKGQENGRVGGNNDDGDLVGVVRDYPERFESHQESNSFDGGDEDERFGVSSISTSGSQSPSSSGRSLELEEVEEIGIEGILSRLEKQRNLSFGIDLGKIGHSTLALNEYGNESLGTSRVADSADLRSSSKIMLDVPNKSIINNSAGKFSHKRSISDFDDSKNSLNLETWTTWSSHPANFSDAKFGDDQIDLGAHKMHEAKNASKEEILAITKGGSTEASEKQKEISHSDIRTRLQHLELELALTLRLLRSKDEVFVSKKGYETSGNDLRKLSDAWEFQENEIMNAQDRLRSIRAKLVVVEGKMALAIIDAQKNVDEKKRRIDDARKALQPLRLACVVWPNPASEVLLAGSYDGWTTQRKMEKSDTGIFSACLKLYPGRYEIKFIVDGVWKTDPLRPIVHSNGHENNLLIIT
ncbi:hypothetical protein U1Q18_029246 [Sarracenia purpurea var. burkii]